MLQVRKDQRLISECYILGNVYLSKPRVTKMEQIQPLPSPGTELEVCSRW